MKDLHLKITKRLGDGRLLILEAKAQITDQEGTDEEIAKMLLEAEMHYNEGRARLHLSVVK